MATGTGLGYSRKVVWGKSCEPQSAEPDTVYVFDAKKDATDLPLIRKWLEALPRNANPLVAVIAPKPADELTLEESDAFQSAIEPLWAYPLDRPVGDADLLTHVRRLLPDLAPIAITDAPPSPFAPMPNADSPDAFNRAAARILRRVPTHDRFD